MTAGTGDFWSRRKAAVAAEEAALDRAAAEARAAAERAAREARSDAESLAELDLPDPDTLSAGDDFKRFMAAAVPERLRRRALRRLWSSNPALANLDSLVDYGEDFTGTGMAAGLLATGYRVGRGMAGHVEHIAQEAEAADGAEAAGSDGTGAADTAGTAGDGGADPPAPRAVAEGAEGRAVADDGTAGETETAPAAAAPRRMAFRFSGGLSGDPGEAGGFGS